MMPSVPGGFDLWIGFESVFSISLNSMSGSVCSAYTGLKSSGLNSSCCSCQTSGLISSGWRGMGRGNFSWRIVQPFLYFLLKNTPTLVYETAFLCLRSSRAEVHHF